MRKHATALATILVAACAQQSPPPAPTASAPPPPAAMAPPAQTVAPRVTSEAQVAPGRWEVARVRCSDILGASDEDRAASLMFYFGYMAAKSNLRVVDVSRIESNVQKVMDQCTAAPDMKVPLAFRRALNPQGS